MSLIRFLRFREFSGFPNLILAAVVFFALRSVMPIYFLVSSIFGVVQASMSFFYMLLWAADRFIVRNGKPGIEVEVAEMNFGDGEGALIEATRQAGMSISQRVSQGDLILLLIDGGICLGGAICAWSVYKAFVKDTQDTFDRVFGGIDNIEYGTNNLFNPQDDTEAQTLPEEAAHETSFVPFQGQPLRFSDDTQTHTPTGSDRESARERDRIAESVSKHNTDTTNDINT